MRRKVIQTLLSLLLTMAFFGVAVAGESTFTLDDIIKRGKIRILVPIDVVPFGMMGKDGKVAYERAKGKKHSVLGVEFGEKRLYKVTATNKMA